MFTLTWTTQKELENRGLEVVEWIDLKIPPAFNINAENENLRIHNPTSLGSAQDVCHMILV